MNRQLLTPYSLKFNPFSAQIPVEALWSSPVIGQFCWRLEQQLGEGGFALISGVSGSGKKPRCAYCSPGWRKNARSPWAC